MPVPPECRLEYLVKDPQRVVEISPAEIPALLIRLAAVQNALAAHLQSSVPALPSSVPGAAVSVSPEDDTLLSADEAAPLLGVTPRWLYRNSRRLPFTRRLSRKVLRFSKSGLLRWITTRKST